MNHLSSRHHICARSRGGTNLPENIIRIQDNVHVALHIVFGNMLPHEQIARIVSIADTALSEEFKSKILRQVDRHPDWIYEKGVLVPR